MRLIWRLLGFVAVMLVIVVGGVFLLPAERLGRIASDQLSTQLGREVELGSAKISVWPVLGVQVAGLRVANADWAGSEPMFRADSASFGMDPLAALQGRFVFRSIEADGPVLRLAVGQNGKGNWDFSSVGAGPASGAGQAPAAGNSQSGIPVLTLDKLSITNGRFIYSVDGTTTELNDTDLTLSWPSTTGPLTLSARLRPAAAPVSIDLRLERPLTMMNGGAAPMTLLLSTDGGTLGFDGLAGSAPEAQGKLTVDLGNSERALAAFGQIGIKLPRGLGQAIKGSLDVTLTRDQQLAVRNGALTLDGNQMTVNADVALAGKPKVNAQVVAQALDLSGLTGTDTAGGGGGGGASSASDGWPRDRIDASGLAAFDGQFSLVADALDLGGFTFGKTRALMTVEDRRAVFELRELQGYDGIMTGQFVANNRGTLSVRADMAFGGVELESLLKDAMDLTRLSGKADGSVNLLGSGSSVAAIIESLSGEGALRAGPGVIAGIDLDQVLSPGGVSGGTTVFKQATGTFRIEGGVMRNSDLFMDLPILQAKGDGRIDLGKRSMDYLITVLSQQARGGRGASIPVRIKGPWSALQIRVDAAEALNQNFAAERKALEDNVRGKVSDALQERLGVSVEQGQSVEDALKQKLESEAANGLLKLLGR